MDAPLKYTITLKNLFIVNKAQIGLQFYPNKVIQALIKQLPNIKWSKEFSMAYVPNTKQNLDLIFSTFKGVAWINTNVFFKDKIINKNSAPVSVDAFRKRKVIDGYRYCPES